MLLQNLKRYLPKTLFGRAMLILILPAVLVQLVAVYMFYERHWDSIVRNMSSALVGEVELLMHQYEQHGEEQMAPVITAGWTMGIAVSFDRSQAAVVVHGLGEERYPEFYQQLAMRIDAPFMVEQVGPQDDLQISILMDEGVLRLKTTKKRLLSSTTYIFLMWVGGSSLVLLVIAVIFLRNQIRPIRQLAQAAERFGLGQDIPQFRPRGASEVRQAGRAFMVMRNRIRRQVDTRTQMLAGISHDLRTPLTRMKLQLEMMPLDDVKRAHLTQDIEEMERMIQEYLDFARGQEKEPTVQVNLDLWLRDMVESYQRQEVRVSLDAKSARTIALRPNAMKRAVQNIIDNALKYGESASVTTRNDGAYVVISVKDEGPGIAENDKEKVFQAFTRLDPARDPQKGGAGLGLSIARDAVQAHGGTIELRNRKKRGLEVVVNLPLHTVSNT